MKTSMTFKSMTLIALLGAALAAPVLAQGGAGMGGGMGGGPGMMQGSGAGGGMGMGPGARGGRGRAMMFDQNNTRGWTLMTQEERNAFQLQMREVKTYEECKLAQTQHRAVMEERAKEKGVTLMTPRMNACDNMKARGWIK